MHDGEGIGARLFRQMSSDRLSFALTSGGLTLPDTGEIAFLGAPGDMALPVPEARAVVIQGFRPDFDLWQRRGVRVETELRGSYAAVVVCLPRARDLAEAWIAAAAAASQGPVIVDGAKTDGIEAIGKALKARVPLLGQVSKAHGKVYWLQADPALADLARPATQRTAEGDLTAPGLFSADGVDPASRALAAALPATLKGRVADLGAGWGWLSREVLKREGVRELHLVEAEKRALDCARENLRDDRAVFHWADATEWVPDAPLDAVVTNPPFHAGRKADPALGRAFISAAARILAPHGQLWLVANRHLPYETALTGLFRDVQEAGGHPGFKILHAARPLRARR